MYVRIIEREKESETKKEVLPKPALLTEEYIGKDSLPRLTTKNTSVTDVFFVYDGYIVDNR